ncbi:MAG: hypothetical protein NC217_08795 [Muribaculaceae bacterium]|nr:hypothetical protein [Muribaculaceae bacterium]
MISTTPNIKENQEERGENSVKTDGGRLHPLWRFLYLLVAPVSGWKRIKNAAYSPDIFARQLFFPLLAFMAVAQFASMIYPPAATLTHTLQIAISIFVAGFGGYFVVVALARIFLPVQARVKIDTRFGRVYVMTCLSVLALALSIFELVPGIGVLFVVAPIYAAYLMVKGIKYLRLPQSENTPAAILMTMLMLIVPMAIFYILEWLMPSVNTM